MANSNETTHPLPQLYMRKSSMDDLRALTAAAGELPEGISLHTHAAGDEAAWEEMLQNSFGCPMSFEACMRKKEGYAPSAIFYLERDGKKLATAAAFEDARFPGEGWLHFVAAAPEAQGLGLAKHIVLAALWSFYVRGYACVMLSTDDFRIPAIKTYLRLGFVPFMCHDSHEARWKDVLEKINSKDGR